MKTLADRMQLVKTVLTVISRQPIRRVEIEKVIISKGPTHHQLDGILRFLVDSGYVQKTDATRFSNVRITEKGCKLLEALK
jgi:predicted transcriptional regulator